MKNIKSDLDKSTGLRKTYILFFMLILAILIPSFSAETASLSKEGIKAHEPIYIDNNLDFTAANGVTNGSGIEIDPYIIENLDINTNTAHGISIWNTDVYFIIRNCIIHDSKNNCHEGITFHNVTNSKIENCEIYNNYRGIRLDSSSNNQITNCTVYNNSCDGIHLYSSSNNNQISNCTIFNNSYDGIWLGGSSNNTQITHCTVYNNSDHGIWLCLSSNNILRDNALENNTYNFGVHGYYVSHFCQDIDKSNTIKCKPIYYLIEQNSFIFDDTMNIGYLGLISCTNITVENLTLNSNMQGLLLANTSYSNLTNCITYNNDYGVYLYSSSNNQIANCTISNNSDGGICLYSSSNNNITNCIAYNNQYGISLAHSSNNNAIANCNMYNNDDGITLVFSSNNSQITNSNVYSNSKDGVWLVHSSNNQITDCAIYNNYYDGICLERSSNSQISSNHIYNNSEDGIRIGYSSYNNLTANQIYNNCYGIELYYSSNNEIHYNNIYNNTNYGIYNHDSDVEYQANATYNWWGSPDGPGDVGPGNGDKVTENVLYDPWFKDSSLTIILTEGGVEEPIFKPFHIFGIIIIAVIIGVTIFALRRRWRK
ncbi:MAG: right-handed parallel beta-helix repeat-containing protein [Thermoplasmatales archaeon]|nr:right-handed parallel beta-helix repeat-containing protein [Thermoplasmatales archaeon]